MTAFAETLLNSSLRITLVAAGVALTLVAARVKSGAVRHSAWAAVLGAMLLMPVLPYCVPPVPIPLPATSRTPNAAFAIREIAAPPDAPGNQPVGLSTAASAPSAPSPSIPRRREADWMAVGFGVYGLVTAALLARLLFGWRSAQQLARRSAMVLELSTDRPIYESRSIAVPLTIGVLTPQITLPLGWREWPNEKLWAVLAHEKTHVLRRDSLVGLLAHLNRCFFWFHPLSWWLERKLAATAEHACDDAAICAAGEPRRYAEILLDLAETARNQGGRFSWQGIGMDGTGLLGQRIDRILSSDHRAASRGRKAIVAGGCAVAIVLAAGCRMQSHAAALEDNPISLKSQAEMKARMDLINAAKAINAQQAAEMESALRQNPEDLDARRRLLIFYTHRGENAIGLEKTITARRSHILWLIQHHPEDPLAASGEALLSPSASDRLFDPLGYAEGKKAWFAAAANAQVNATVLANAAAFFRVADKPASEKLLLRARAIDPKGHWSTQLGRLYYEALVGSNALMPMGVVRSVSDSEMHGSYAAEVREKLAKSTDAGLLESTGYMLTIWGNLFTRHNIDFDPVQLGKTFLERAVQIDPQSTRARGDLEQARIRERDAALFDALRKKQESEYVASLPEAERYRVLAQLSQRVYMRADVSSRDPQHAAESKALLAKSKAYAQDALRLAANSRNDPDYGTALYVANMTLGMLAMQDGNRKAAVGYLLEASRAPRTDELAYSMQYVTLKLPQWLLKDGERETVVEFLQRFAETNVAQKNYLLESATLIRNGKKPVWYQD